MSNRINPFGSDSFSRIDGPPPPFVGSERGWSEFGGGSAAGAVIEDSPVPPLRFRPKVRTRFDVTLNEKLAKDFEELALSEGVSRAEIFKRAMAAYKIIKQIQNSDAKIVVQRDGQLDRELIAI